MFHLLSILGVMNKASSWDQDAFGQRLDKARKAKGFRTQRALCQHMGLLESTLSQWKNSPSNKPGLADIVDLCKTLQVSPGWLAFGEDDRDEIEC